MLFPVDSNIFGCHAGKRAALNNVLKVHLVGLPRIQTMTLLLPRETEDHLVDVDLEGSLAARYVMSVYLTLKPSIVFNKSFQSRKPIKKDAVF